MKTHIKITCFLFLLLSTILTGCDEENEPAVSTNGLVADAGLDHFSIVNETIQLDGSGSHNKNEEPFSYLWSIISKPAASIVEISNARVVSPSFKANKVGDYVIQLKITQGQWSAIDELNIHLNSVGVTNTVTLSEAIVEDTNLVDIFTDPTKVDYIVTADIDVRADVLVAPGVVIAFEQDKGMQITSGSLQAKGTFSNRITFKGTEAGTGYWKGLVFYSNSELNVLDYVTVQDGGSKAFDETGVSTNIALAGTEYSGATIRISNSVVTTSGGYGLYLQGASHIDIFSNNNFTQNTQAAAFIPVQQLHKLEGTSWAIHNGLDGAETGGTLPNTEVTWRKEFGGIYHVTSNVLINGGLSISPGVILFMDEEVTITVSPTGYLKAAGTSTNKILFSTTAEYWNGIAFNSNSPNNLLDNCIISNGGRTQIADADQKGNIVVGASAFVSVRNSSIKNGNGYGIVAKDLVNLNSDVLTVNFFENLSQGAIYPVPLAPPEKPSLTGTWVDRWTLSHEKSTIDENLYDRESGKWFGGAPDPYSASNAGFGLKINDGGNFIWTNVEYFGVFECPSHTADYMTGSTVIHPNNWLTFNLDYWRSMFFSSCDATTNVDTDVSTSPVTMHYEINELYDTFTGELLWELKFYRPDGSTFSLYRK